MNLKTGAVWIVCLLFFGSAYSQQKLNKSIEQKVDALLRQMTLEEKVGQMAQVSIESLGWAEGQHFSFNEKMKDAVVNYKVGSLLNTPGPLQSVADWNRLITEIQDAARQTRLKIPVLYGLDNIHGVNYSSGTTLFPQPIAQAATWNPSLVHEIGVITAYESRAVGAPWTFSPALDLGTNPQWPRMWEGFGEDPYLISQMGNAFIHGVQDPLGDKEKLVVSLKHYLDYSDPKSGHDRTDSWIPEYYLREYHLPPFIEGVNAGARTVMVNSSLINGIPTHVNKHLLTDVLKDELGFTGFVVSDWQDIENVYRRDKIVNSIKEAIALAINAGIDMSMIPYDYKAFCGDLISLVKEGVVSQSRIDDAVRRILRVKFESGIFETPVTNRKDYPKLASAEFTKASYNTAVESITLLKNEKNVLPLKPNAKVLVTGPNANSIRSLNGGWTYTWQGEKTNEYGKQYNTILKSLQNKLGAGNVVFVPGVEYIETGRYDADSIIDLKAVTEAAKNVDYILLCMGENSYTETPGNTYDLSLSENQAKLAESLKGTGKPVIFILNEGRPRIFNKIEPIADGILHVYLPGNYGADALADILTGKVNPSGKLPFTYPRYVNDLVSYIHKPSEGSSNPQGGETNPQYPFGYGLSYTSFTYSNLTISKSEFSPEESAVISITVTNNGNQAGKEVVQLYVSDLVASLTPDVKRLRAFEKVELKPGESKNIRFNLPLKDLAFVGTDLKKHLEAGEFRVQIADLSATFSVSKTIVF